MTNTPNPAPMTTANSMCTTNPTSAELVCTIDATVVSMPNAAIDAPNTSPPATPATAPDAAPDATLVTGLFAGPGTGAGCVAGDAVDVLIAPSPRSWAPSWCPVAEAPR
jgi:hypothetical protein